MAVRVLLLMALTGMFAAAWNSDCQHAATEFNTTTVTSKKSEVTSGESNEELSVSDDGQTITISREFDRFAISLPASIAPGTYRVVDAQGRCGWMTIPVGDALEVSTNEPESFYTSRSKSGHWYFIRVEAAPIVAAPHTAGAVLR